MKKFTLIAFIGTLLIMIAGAYFLCLNISNVLEGEPAMKYVFTGIMYVAGYSLLATFFYMLYKKQG